MSSSKDIGSSVKMPLDRLTLHFPKKFVIA